MNDAQPQVNRAWEATRAMSEEWHAEPGVLVMNTDGVIRRCDAGAEGLFGYQSCELEGVSVSGLFPYLFGRRLVSEGGDSIDSHIAYLCAAAGLSVECGGMEPYSPPAFVSIWYGRSRNPCCA